MTTDKIRLVLVEDDDLICLGLRSALASHPVIEWLAEAHTAEAGLAAIQATQPDVAIVDIGLPDIDGIELTKQIKQLSLPVTPKVLILTLNTRGEAVLAAFSAGADSYCMKDIRLELLLEALKATHLGQAWIDPAIAGVVLAQARGARPLSADANLPSYPLTERELEVLQLIVDGLSNAAIADKLFITVGTVKTHVRNILNKLCADDRTQAAVRALRAGLVG